MTKNTECRPKQTSDPFIDEAHGAVEHMQAQRHGRVFVDEIVEDRAQHVLASGDVTLARFAELDRACGAVQER